MAPHIRSHRALCSCFPEKVTTQLSSEQFVGDAGITQLIANFSPFVVISSAKYALCSFQNFTSISLAKVEKYSVFCFATFFNIYAVIVKISFVCLSEL